MPAHRLLSLVLRAKTALPAAGLGAALLLAAPTPARAQSAADKATARELATAGIKLYRAGNYKDALDKVTRAEALYDAPIHLLYIARCQVKLGKVVEGAETYRKLGRVHLSANAPAAFKNAQASGAKELTALEPQIPALRVEVTPANVNDMDVVIDGEHLPPAVVGIDRPADPGQHTVRVTAPGFEAAETTVEVKLGEKKPVKLTLKPGTGAAAAGGTSPGGTSPSGGTKGGSAPAGGAQTGTGKTKAPATTSKKPSNIGFMAGLRIGGVFSTGSALKGVKMSAIDGAGGGAELHGGVRLWHLFTPVLFGYAGALKPPTQHLFDPKNTNIEIPSHATTGSYQGGGIGVMVGTPPGRLGGFGELDFVVDTMVQNSTVKVNVQKLGLLVPTDCHITNTLSGAGGRIGGGVVIPVASILELTPFAMVTLEKFNEMKFSTEALCANKVVPAYPIAPTIQDQAVHETFFLGVGGDFIFGSDKPSK